MLPESPDRRPVPRTSKRWEGVGRLPLERAGKRIVPRYLTARDELWLEELLHVYASFVGASRAALDARLREPLVCPAPQKAFDAARKVLDRAYSDRTDAPFAPARIREAFFLATTQLRRSAPEKSALVVRAEALALTAEALPFAGDPQGLLAWLFADLPTQRVLRPLAEPISSGELALLTNHSMLAELLRRAIEVAIRAQGETRALVRAAKLRGLLVSVAQGDEPGSAVLHMSGPFALFRHTRVYGGALASLAAHAARCPRFELRASCVLGGQGQLAELVIGSGDPIAPSTSLRRYDSKLEERFAKDFAALASSWDVVREPRPVVAGRSLMFPDFLLRHRRNPRRSWLLEIIGYWTPAYLDRKLKQIAEARLPQRYLVCIDEGRNCSDADFPPTARVVYYKRRIPADEVLKALTLEPDSWP